MVCTACNTAARSAAVPQGWALADPAAMQATATVKKHEPKICFQFFIMGGIVPSRAVWSLVFAYFRGFGLERFNFETGRGSDRGAGFSVKKR
jgi:hypothetical protein